MKLNPSTLTSIALLLAAPLLLAPTCTGAEQNAGQGDYLAQKVTALVCSDNGDLLGLTYVTAGSTLWACEAKVYDATCECPTVLETYSALVAIPGTSLVPASAALVCWGQATANPYPDEYLVDRVCTALGVYQPGPEGPQAAAPGDEPGA